MKTAFVALSAFVSFIGRNLDGGARGQFQEHPEKLLILALSSVLATLSVSQLSESPAVCYVKNPFLI